MIETILAAIWSYLSSVWTMARVIFSTFDSTLMVNCLQLLGVVLLIGIIDNLPEIFKRKKKDPEDEDEYEWVRRKK